MTTLYRWCIQHRAQNTTGWKDIIKKGHGSVDFEFKVGSDDDESQQQGH